MRLIDEEYTRHPFYGSRKLRNWLRRQGYRVNRKRVQRLMRRMGLVSIAPKPNTSLAAKAHKIYPYLLRGLEIDHSNQVWCSDITYVRLARGFVYLTVVMDWHSRYVLSWEVSVTLDGAFCVSALESALRRHGRPEIFNTDQGAQYTAEAFTGTLKQADIGISMDGVGARPRQRPAVARHPKLALPTTRHPASVQQTNRLQLPLRPGVQHNVTYAATDRSCSTPSPAQRRIALASAHFVRSL